jgi:hypothetical protein
MFGLHGNKPQSIFSPADYLQKNPLAQLFPQNHPCRS